MYLRTVTELLESHGIAYDVSGGTEPDAKTLLVRIDGALGMALIPIDHRLRLDMLKEIVDAQSVRMAQDSEVPNIFSDCEPSAIPPFGILHGMHVFVS